jgi:hypothetical protein
MKKKYYLLISIGVIVTFMVFDIMCQKAVDEDRASTTSALATTTAGIADLYLDTNHTIDNETKKKLLKVIRDQTLILVSLGIRPSEMNAEGFSGICRLVYFSPRLFNIPDQDSIDGATENFLRKRFSEQRVEIASESARRRARVGDNHRCEGFN